MESIEKDKTKPDENIDIENIESKTKMLETNIRIMKNEQTRLLHEKKSIEAKLTENNEKVSDNIVEILDNDPQEDEASDGSAMELSTSSKGKTAVIQTSTRQTIYLPIIGLVDHTKLKPNDLVGVNKDSYLLLDILPPEYDSRVKAMELEEKPVEDYCDIGGLSNQITELKEAVALPIQYPERFKTIGIKPPRGVLLHGPPGTGKTLMARACANQTECAFLKIAAPQLVQMYIGDGAKIVRDAFALARSKAPALIFIDELDAIGSKRYGGDSSGGREVQRTMLALLNEMDGFSPNERISVIAATNRPELLDPALLRSGRLDRKIELPIPDQKARVRILEIHSAKMRVSPDVNYDEISRSTEDFNGAQLKAVCVEAGMLALRRDATELTHQDYVDGIAAVQAKKKVALSYYA